MAEFCLECFNKSWGENLTEKEVVFAKDFCEGCAEYKPCVMRIREKKKFEFPFFFKKK